MTSLSRTLSALSRTSELHEGAPYVNNPDLPEVLEHQFEEKSVPRDNGKPEQTLGDVCGSAHTVVDAEAQAAKVEYVEPGWRGWLNVAGSVVVNMLCCGWTCFCLTPDGMTQSFGVFQQYYETHLGVSSMAISWIGAIQFALCPML